VIDFRFDRQKLRAKANDRVARHSANAIRSLAHCACSILVEICVAEPDCL
jgi:hypothetical protein